MSQEQKDKLRAQLKDLDSYNETQLKDIEKEYKQVFLPTHRLYALIGYNIVAAGMCIYYTLNFKRISRKYFQPKRFGILELFKFGTIQSAAFVSTYIAGTCLVTGLWHPIDYLRDLAKIQGKIIDNTLKFDANVQQHLLLNMLDYFGLSQDTIEKVSRDLHFQKQQLLERKFFSEETLKLLDQAEEEQKAELKAEKTEKN